MNNMLFYTILFLVSVFISSISQIILKKSAEVKYASVIREYLNPMVITAYTIFLASTLLTTFAYKGVPLSLGPVLEATGYIYVAVLGTLILKEKLSRRKIIGNVLIIAGIMVFALLLYIALPFLFKTGNFVLNVALVLAAGAFLAFWFSLVFRKEQDRDAD